MRGSETTVSSCGNCHDQRLFSDSVMNQTRKASAAPPSSDAARAGSDSEHGADAASDKRPEPAPPKEQKFVRYSVKYVCGLYEDGCEYCAPVQPGEYATQINIHNYSNEIVEIRKLFIPVVFAGAPAGREPNVARARAHDAIRLEPHTATMDDCCRITELLFGDSVNSLNIGLLELTASRDVAVTAVYTTATSLDVQTISGREV